ncbi:ATP synthase F0 subunit B [Acidobacteriota bacterium]
MLDLDSSLFIVIALVWIIMIILERIYFRPVKDVIGKREGKIAVESGQIEEMTREIEEKTGRIENILREAKWDAASLKEELIREGEIIKEQVRSDTREESKRLFAKKMKELDREIIAAREKLEKDIDLFSQKIREKFI